MNANISAEQNASEAKQKIVLAGGCFWGMEELLRAQTGVISTVVGYAGGEVESPNYEVVSAGSSGHAESVEITYDTQKTNLAVILDFFFKIHDPTTKNRQGNDVGTQYRSAIFITDESQREEAEKAIQRANESKRWKAPVVTEVKLVEDFYPAEGYHQDYLQKNPGGYTCHFVRE